MSVAYDIEHLEELKGYRSDLLGQLNGFHWGFLSENT